MLFLPRLNTSPLRPTGPASLVGPARRRRWRGRARRNGWAGNHVAVEQGDTLTFSAWAYLFPARAALPRPNRLHLVPLPLPLPTATPAAAATDNAPGTSAPAAWRNRLSAGLALVGWGGKAPLPARLAAFPANVWLRYRVFDEAGTQVAEHYEYLTAKAPQRWQPLQTALRVAQAGTVQVAIGSDDGDWQAYFDDLRLEQTGGLIVQEQHQYAYGSPLVGLNYAVGTKRYRYGYQGKYAEKDPETGFESFELRLYNARLGRWTSNDPEGQFSSPYVGMGNNPVSGVDPDGGLSGTVWGMIVGGLVGGAVGIAETAKDPNATFGSYLGNAIGGAAVGSFVGAFAGMGIGALGPVGRQVVFNAAGKATAKGYKMSYEKVSEPGIAQLGLPYRFDTRYNVSLQGASSGISIFQTGKSDAPSDKNLPANETYIDNGGDKTQPLYKPKQTNNGLYKDAPHHMETVDGTGIESGRYIHLETSIVELRPNGKYKILMTFTHGYVHYRADGWAPKSVSYDPVMLKNASRAHKKLLRNFVPGN